MTGPMRYNGFLEKEEEISYVDQDLEDIVRSSYKIIGFGSHCVSCAGHFYEEKYKNKKIFWPKIEGSLGFAALPELQHIKELIGVIYNYTLNDSDAYIEIDPNNIIFSKGFKKSRKYNPSIDLKEYSIMKTNSGLFVVQLIVNIGDNGCLGPLGKDYCGGYVPVDKNKKVYEESKKRHLEIKSFWKEFGHKIYEYNKKTGFETIDFKKSEFLPFC